jgi:hypothetical protein
VKGARDGPVGPRSSKRPVRTNPAPRPEFGPWPRVATVPGAAGRIYLRTAAPGRYEVLPLTFLIRPSRHARHIEMPASNAGALLPQLVIPGIGRGAIGPLPRILSWTSLSALASKPGYRFGSHLVVIPAGSPSSFDQVDLSAAGRVRGRPAGMDGPQVLLHESKIPCQYQSGILR